MKPRSQRYLWIPLFLTLLGAAPAHAEDFNITVPLSLNALPSDVIRFMLFCSAYANEPRLGGRSIGMGNTSVEIAGGAYSGSPTVRFNANAGLDPALATHYGCTSYFVGRGVAGAVPPFYFQNSTGPTFPLAAGATFLLNTGVQPIPR